MEHMTDPTDANRCIAAAQSGQCHNIAAPGSERCQAHGGQDLTEQHSMEGYLLAKVQDRTRLAGLSKELEPVKELRDTIGLLHMLIERRFNMMKDDNDLIQACGPLCAMIDKMEKLVSSCHKIEQNLGQLLAKQAILMLAKKMVTVMIEELAEIPDYEATIDRITDRLLDLIRGAGRASEPTTLDLPPLKM